MKTKRKIQRFVDGGTHLLLIEGLRWCPEARFFHQGQGRKRSIRLKAFHNKRRSGAVKKKSTIDFSLVSQMCTECTYGLGDSRNHLQCGERQWNKAGVASEHCAGEERKSLGQSLSLPRFGDIGAMLS